VFLALIVTILMFPLPITGHLIIQIITGGIIILKITGLSVMNKLLPETIIIPHL